MSETIQNQFWLLAEMRWLILRNSLRLKSKKLELAGQIFAGTMGAVIALALGLVMGGVTELLLAKGKTSILPALLEAIFFAWQLGPILIEGASPSLDFREIARYPISFRLYYLLNIAYGLFDPWALLCLVWLGCIWVGMAAARPDLALTGALWFLAFAVLNLLLNRTVFSLLNAVINSRRGRERLFAVFIFLVLGMQFAIYGLLARLKKKMLPLLGQIFSSIHNSLPAGFVTRALLGTHWTDICVAAMAMLGYSLLAALALRRQLWRNYCGDTFSEVRRQRWAVQMQPAWNLPWLDAATSAIVEKELRYAKRDSRAWVACLSGPLMAFIIIESSEALRVTAIASKISMSTVFILIAGLILVGFAQEIYNSFAFDARGFHRWLLSPVDFQRVLVGKDIALGIQMVASFVVASLMLAARGGISFTLILYVTCAFLFGTLAMLGAGNLFSVHFPVKFELGGMNSGKPSIVSVLLGLLVQGSIMGSLGLMFYAAHRWELDRLPLVTLPLMILLAVKGYLYSLKASSKYAELHAEDIIAVLA